MYQFINNLKSDKTFFFYRGGVALYALLWAMNIEPNDEVILQAFTCPAVPSPIVRLGATPVYSDINRQTFNLDPSKIETSITKKTKAIIVQHTFGIPADMKEILAIAQKYNLRIIEDCCHALGSKYHGQEVGTFGDAAIYSFGWHKPIVLGVGGAAVVNNSALRRKVAELHKDFVEPSWKELVPLHIQNLAYNMLLNPSLYWGMRGLYRKLSNQGVIAGSRHRGKASKNGHDQITSPRISHSPGRKIIPFQDRRLFRILDDFDRMVTHHRRIVSRYENLLDQTQYTPVELENHLEPNFYKYPLLSEQKKDILAQAPQARVELSDMFVSPIYPAWRKAVWKSLGYRQGICPISEEVSDNIVALPVHSKVQPKNIKKTITFLESFQ